MKSRPHKRLWIIVDKFGCIVESGRLRPIMQDPYDRTNFLPPIPPETLWANRYSARCILQRIKKHMTEDAYRSWGFKIVHYELVKNDNIFK